MNIHNAKVMLSAHHPAYFPSSLQRKLNETLPKAYEGPHRVRHVNNDKFKQLGLRLRQGLLHRFSSSHQE